jgi:hypothetical protein
MRIPSGVTDQYIYFVAVDATDFTTRETGFSSFTVYRSRNGAAAAAMTTPTVNETDSSNMPGVYELLLDEDTTIDAGDDEQEMVLHITHAGMAPVTRVVTIFRPKVTAGYTLGVESDGDLTKVNTLDGHTAQTGDSFARIGATGSGLTSLAQASAYTASRAAYLDELAAANLPTDVDSLLSRLSAARAGYLDNLSAGAVALASAVAALNDFDPASETVDVGAILGTALTEAAGALADSFSYLLDVATPAKTMNDIGVAGAGLSAADVWTYATRVLTAGTNLNDLDAAGVRTAVGMASANLDTQLATIAGYIDTEVGSIASAIAALNDLSQADIRTALGMASNDLDTQLDTLPTAAEIKTAIEAAGSHLTLIKAVTDVIPDSGAMSSIATAAAVAALNDLDAAGIRTAVGLASANLDTQIDAVPTAAEIKTAIEAAGSHLALIKAVTDALTAAAAAKLALSAGTMVTGTVSHDNTAATTTVFYSDDITEATTDHYKDRLVFFTSGVLQGQFTDITGYELASGEGKLTVTALTEAPADNVTFIIV